MELILTMLVAGTSGLLIGVFVWLAKKIKDKAELRSKESKLLRKPLFQKFLIPMIIPVCIFLFVIFFVLISMVFGLY